MKYKLRKISVYTAVAVLVLCVCFCAAFGQVLTSSEENSKNDYAEIFGYRLNELAVYINKGGTYTLSGAYEGMVYVDVDSSDSVTLILDGAAISNEDGPAIYVANSGQCTLEIAEGSNNTVISGMEIALNSENIDRDEQYGAITFKDDAVICGAGTLEVYGYINNGIHCSNNLRMEGGDITVTALNKGMKGNDSLTIDGGSLKLTVCGKALFSEESLTVNGGEITVCKSFEGFEGNQIIINDGTISIIASDDGMNASGGNSLFGGGGFGGFGGRLGLNTGGQTEDAAAESSTPNLIINGGTIYVNAAGDGLDSNGNLIINGGYITVEGPTNSANGALDSGTENGGTLLVNGGTLLAVGASGMAETPENASTQCYIGANTNFTAGTQIRLLQDGEELFEFTCSKSGSSVILSSPQIEQGNTYTLCIGTEEFEFTVNSIANNVGPGNSKNMNTNTPNMFNNNHSGQTDKRNRQGNQKR